MFGIRVPSPTSKTTCFSDEPVKAVTKGSFFDEFKLPGKKLKLKKKSAKKTRGKAGR